MKQPIYVRELTEEKQQIVEAGHRSRDATRLRRCQMVWMSTQGQQVPEIAKLVGCCRQTVRNLTYQFNTQGVAALQPGSRRHHSQAAFDDHGIDCLRELLHHSPQDYGKPSSLWTLDLAAEVCSEQGITYRLVRGEPVRAALERIGIRFKRAKNWITSP